MCAFHNYVVLGWNLSEVVADPVLAASPVLGWRNIPRTYLSSTVGLSIWWSGAGTGVYTRVPTQYLIHAWVQVFIELLRFAIGLFIYCNIEESWLLRQTQRHVWKTHLETLVGALWNHLHNSDNWSKTVTWQRSQWCQEKYILDNDRARRLRLCCRKCTWQQLAEVGYLAVQQEMLYGGHILYPAVWSICETSLLEYLAKNKLSIFPVGQWS